MKKSHNIITQVDCYTKRHITSSIIVYGKLRSKRRTRQFNEYENWLTDLLVLDIKEAFCDNFYYVFE